MRSAYREQRAVTITLLRQTQKHIQKRNKIAQYAKKYRSKKFSKYLQVHIRNIQLLLATTDRHSIVRAAYTPHKVAK